MVTISAHSTELIRYPAFNRSGTRIAFSYQGDIWTSGIDGSGVKRLTIHQAYEGNPCWSPDDSHIAFSSSRYGNDDIFTIPAEGGMSRRLTWHSSNDRVGDWTVEHGIIFTTTRNYRQVEWETEIHAVDPDGDTPTRILDALGTMAAVSPDGRYIAFVRGACRITREYYRGPANRKVWLYDTENGSYIRVDGSDAQDIYPRWYDENTLYFLSSRDGRYNVYSVSLQSGSAGEAVRITDFGEDGVRYFDLSPAADRIVAEVGTGIYIINADGSSAQELQIEAGTDYRFDPFEYKTYSSDVNHYSVSPDGKYSAMVIRGEVFITENSKKKKRTVNISRSPFRDIEPVWTSDTTLVYLSDREGQYDLYLVRSSDDEETDLFRSLKHSTVRLTETREDESSLTASPGGDRIAFVRGRGMLITASLNENDRIDDQKVLLDGWATPEGVSWSPDGEWLAYSLEDLNFNAEIYIHSADGSGDPVNVSMHPRGDYWPEWSPAGDKLGFVSSRNNRDSDIWFVWLKESDWEKTRQDWEEEEDDEENQKEKDDGEEKEPVVIDFEDIHERLRQITSLPGDESNILISGDGKTFYFTAASPSGKGTDLFSIEWDGQEMKQLTTGGQNPSHLRAGSKKLYMLKKGRLARINMSGNKMENIAFAASMRIDHINERKQIFREACRTLTAGFYDPDFHGKDWESLKEKYEKWAMAASTKRDFRDVFNLMVGQLDASHMGLYGKDRARTQELKTGMLGIEIEPVRKGVKVVRVIPDTPAERSFSRLFEEDLITAVDGRPVEPGMNFYSLLVNKPDEKLLLSVENAGGGEREVALRPAGSIREELYNEWVDRRREMTEEISEGKLGYLHIQAMGWRSFERFEREFTAAASGKEGIVIDVRFNGGGWTTDYLMAVLNIDQHSYTIPRGAADDLDREHTRFRDYYPYAERLPFYPWMKPSVALCNESSYSNAEIFSHAYKTLGIGTLVGKPTFGAVISTGGKRLIDGSYVRLPFRGWYVRATDQNMEHGPAVPDIIVDNPPESKGRDEDPQLERAVEVLLEKI
ncbi:MAG: peptidase S41 [Candidatus Latescibacteria bacterium]|nr:peptidase S41 [bacterium]MBD3424206.1 peptidase S41 [Candidatus Latescibacterota bacterium]